ncbi:hypothetical protein MTO96_018038 [Rhipicephalus appendiculatus]
MDAHNVAADSTDVRKLNAIQKYEDRPQSLRHLHLAKFVSSYTGCKNNRRDILDRRRYVEFYEEHLHSIVKHRKSYEKGASADQLDYICRDIFCERCEQPQCGEGTSEPLVMGVDNDAGPTRAVAQNLCPGRVRLFYSTIDADAYNSSLVTGDASVVVSNADEIIISHKSQNQHDNAGANLATMKLCDTGGGPARMSLCVGKPYRLTANVDVTDGLVNGAIGLLRYI